MFQFGRIGLAGSDVVVHRRELVARDTCDLASGDLYLYPNSTSTVDATLPVTFTWDTSCNVSTTALDLYLFEPSASNSLIKAITGIPFSTGSYTLTLQPSWWNDTTTTSLQSTFVPSGYTEYWSMPAGWVAGPVFTVDYAASAMYSVTTKDGVVSTSTAAAASTETSNTVFQSVSETSGHKTSKGVIAAAVIVPIVVLSIVAAIAVYFYRLKEKEKRKRWSQALSTHSNLDWEKGARAGENAASIHGRPSTQFGRPSTSYGRPSMSSMNRPASSIFAENMAGAGAGTYGRPAVNSIRPQSTATDFSAPARVNADGNARQSRISFADTARPDRRSRASFGGDVRPQIATSGVWKQAGASRSATDITTPSKSAVYAAGSALDDEEDINVSPSQLQGPNAFADAEMHRAAHGRRTGRRSMMSLGSRRESTTSALSADDFKSAASARGSVDELRDMEAIMLMRRSVMSQASGRSPQLDGGESEFVEALDQEIPPVPAMPAPVAGSSTVAYGPDQMLAVYAARGKVNASPTTGSSFPTPGPVSMPKPAATGMRRLLGRKDSSAESMGMKSRGQISSPVRPASDGSDNSQYDDEIGEAR